MQGAGLDIADGMSGPSREYEKMPTKISEVAVCRQIVSSREEDIQCMLDHGHMRMQYTRAQFDEDMRRNSLIVTRSTIQEKWRILCADKVISVSERRTDLDIRTLYLRANLPMPKAAEYTIIEGDSE